MTADVIAEMLADVEEFLDSADGLEELLSGLHGLAEVDAPTPDAELRALLAGAAPTLPRRSPGTRRSAIAGLAAATVATLTMTGAAAAANNLPAPLQRGLAHFSELYLPFSFPRPVGDPPLAAQPAAAPAFGSATGLGSAHHQDDGRSLRQSGEGPAGPPRPRHGAANGAEPAHGATQDPGPGSADDSATSDPGAAVPAPDLSTDQDDADGRPAGPTGSDDGHERPTTSTGRPDSGSDEAGPGGSATAPGRGNQPDHATGKGDPGGPGGRGAVHGGHPVPPVGPAPVDGDAPNSGAAPQGRG